MKRRNELPAPDPIVGEDAPPAIEASCEASINPLSGVISLMGHLEVAHDVPLLLLETFLRQKFGARNLDQGAGFVAFAKKNNLPSRLSREDWESRFALFGQKLID